MPWHVSTIKFNMQNIKSILLSSAFSIILFWFALFFPIFIFIPAWALVYLGLKSNSYQNTMIASFISLVTIFFVFGKFYGLIFLLLEINIAFLLLFCIYKNISSEYTSFFSIIYLVLVSIIFFIVFYILTNKYFHTFVYERLSQYLDSFIYPNIIKDEQAVFKNTIFAIKDYFYTIFFIYFCISFAIAYHIACAHFKKMKIMINPYFLNNMWRPKEILVYGLILSSFSYIICSKFFASYKYLNIINLNIVIIFGFLYILNGLMLFFYFTKRLAINFFIKFLFLILILFSPLMIISLGIFGLSDVWLDFRSRARL
jgi:hypothetical protein